MLAVYFLFPLPVYPGIQLQVLGLTQAPPFWHGGSHTAAEIAVSSSINLCYKTYNITYAEYKIVIITEMYVICLQFYGAYIL